MRQFILNLIRNRKGAALVEYSMLIAGVALVSAAALSIFGHKTSDMIAATATVLPGVHADDNGTITSGKLVETTSAADGAIEVDTAGILADANTERLGSNIGVTLSGLVVEAD
jgi:pilus assembly protein Flp/PilA